MTNKIWLQAENTLLLIRLDKVFRFFAACLYGMETCLLEEESKHEWLQNTGEL